MQAIGIEELKNIQKEILDEVVAFCEENNIRYYLAYGTPKDFVYSKLDQGISVILEIEMQGALKVKEQYPETVLIFMTPPTAEELEERLRGRGTETEEVIASRLARAFEEAEYMKKYDYVVVNENGKVAECAALIHNIVETEKRRAIYSVQKINELTEGLVKYKKGE